uniref:TonB family protein n=1 Tax=Cyanothece sp. (strain PCC 7425 / ATCC 29141) TaxID=395961 RepID=B8HQC8_CYAP4
MALKRDRFQHRFLRICLPISCVVHAGLALWFSQDVQQASSDRPSPPEPVQLVVIDQANSNLETPVNPQLRANVNSQAGGVRDPQRSPDLNLSSSTSAPPEPARSSPEAKIPPAPSTRQNPVTSTESSETQLPAPLPPVPAEPDLKFPAAPQAPPFQAAIPSPTPQPDPSEPLVPSAPPVPLASPSPSPSVPVQVAIKALPPTLAPQTPAPLTSAPQPPATPPPTSLLPLPTRKPAAQPAPAAPRPRAAQGSVSTSAADLLPGGSKYLTAEKPYALFNPEQTAYGTPGVAAQRDQLGPYLEDIYQAIVQRWARTPVDQSRRVRLQFTIDRQGNLVNGVQLLESSGFVAADQAAMQAVRAAAPFGPLPATTTEERLSITFTFKYTLY